VLSNLRLSLSVFLSQDVTSAKRLRRAKHLFRILILRYSHAHVERLHRQNVKSIETSSLHLGLGGGGSGLSARCCAGAAP
ncbi:Na/Pi cotransporter family protein, partial [Pantoea dispersa]|nr:Na/Pi cotransporter family protein [Pantoea dispersa]